MVETFGLQIVFIMAEIQTVPVLVLIMAKTVSLHTVLVSEFIKGEIVSL
jgi:hypothetical protein